MKILYNLGIMVFLCLNVMAQSASRPISGKVIDINGNALENANVRIKNGRGTVTNVRGEFTLSSVKNTDLIEFSYVGYKTITVQVKDQTSLIISLHPADNELDQVVVQGYGVTSKRLATGNIVTVTSEQIERSSVMNPLQVLQGNVPGLVMTNASGASSSPAQIEIRGRNNISPNAIAEPLYIIDGVPMTVLNLSNQTVWAGGAEVSLGSIQTGILNRAGLGAGGQSVFFNLNPGDIESIEVLKDADATAIYGTRAANGVILITTKKGKPGKTVAEVKVSTGMSKVARYHPILNTQQYVEMRKEALINDNRPINAQYAPDLVIWDTTRYTDWQEYLFGGIGKRTSLQSSISGGDARINFRISAAYDFDLDITTLKGGNQRGSFSLNLNHTSLNHRLKYTLTSRYDASKISVVNKGGSVLLPPNAPAKNDSEGKLNFLGWDPIHNPFGEEKNFYESSTSLLNSNFTVSYEIMAGLKIYANLGFNKSDNKQLDLTTIASQHPDDNPHGKADNGITKFSNLISEPKIEYSNFISKGKLLVLLGSSYQYNRSESYRLTGSNYTNDVFLRSINLAPTITSRHVFREYKYAGFFGRVNYNWENKYILNLNARRDGSSRFGPGKKYGNFGSIGASWIISEEEWMKNIKFLSFAKLRGSYGLTGSDNIGDYQYFGLWNFGSNIQHYNNSSILLPTGFYDSTLHWEVNKKFELAFSLGFLNDRILFEFAYYRNTCNNQLLPINTPVYSGFSSVTSNFEGNVENKGYEFILKGGLIEKKDFKFDIGFSINFNKNKLLSYPDFENSPYRSRLVIGQPIGLVKRLKYLGVDPENGTYLFADLNKDGIITYDLSSLDDDKYAIDVSPKYHGSFNLDLNYKKFRLSAHFYYIKKYATNILTAFTYPYGGAQNYPTEIMNRWRNPGDKTEIGKFTTILRPDVRNYLSNSDARISDGSFIRLQNLHFSYEFTLKNIKKSSGINIRAFLQADNLFVITNYKGIDPEINSVATMPRPKVLTAGISCSL